MTKNSVKFCKMFYIDRNDDILIYLSCIVIKKSSVLRIESFDPKFLKWKVSKFWLNTYINIINTHIINIKKALINSCKVKPLVITLLYEH